MTTTSSRRLSKTALVGWVLAGAVVASGFLALGGWQVQRRAWKLELIDQIASRVHAAPVAAPARLDWPQVTAARDGYRHVQLRGVFDHEREALVQASTVLGAGFWVLTPLRQADGSSVFVNRGFVPPDHRDRATRLADEPAGEVTVNGLLRLTEPGGGFLRTNDPAADKWYSRDIAGIATARRLSDAAPYFVDQDAPADARVEGRWPVGGLTVVTFPNNHLQYALTWFALAAMVIAGTGFLVYTERRRTMA